MSGPHDPPKPEDLLEHARFLRGLARRLVRDESEADELVQETWIEALRRRAEPIANLRPWLAGVLRNLARERARGAGRRARREREAARPEGLEPTANVLERIENFRVLAREVIELDEPYRSTIVQMYFEGLGAHELAAREGIPAATVRSRHMRALQQLRERLDRRYEDRETWQLLFLPWLGLELPPPRTPLATKFVLGGLVLCALVGTWLAWRAWPAHAPDERELASAPAAPAGARPADTEPATSVGAQVDPREPSERARAPAASANAPRARLELVLRDAHTGEVVPEFRVDVRDADGNVESVTSDARGELTSRREHAAGALDLLLVDEPRLAAWRERPRAARVVKWIVPWTHAPGAGRLPLDVEIGPTYRVALEDATPGEVRAALAGELVRLTATPRGGARRETRAPLRATDGVLWVRFSNEARTLPLADVWRLELLAGGRTARATVESRTGVARELTHLRWTPSGILALSAHDALGPAHVAFVVTAEDADESGDAGELDGVVRELPLAAGAYRVSAGSRRHPHVEHRIEVRGGERVELDLALERTPGAGTIEGRVVLDAAPADPDVRVWLCDLATDERTSVLAVPSAANPLVREFRFDDVPPGEHVVCARAAQRRQWEPGEVHVRAPARDVVLAAVPPDDPRKLVIRVFDAATGAWVWHFDADVDVDPDRAQGPVHEPRNATTGSVHFGAVPRRAHFEWTVTAEGYRAARGDERAVQDLGDHLLVRVELERGWASELDVVDVRGAPLANATVLLDGADVGRTDARGRVWVTTAAAPREAAVRAAGARETERVPLPIAPRDHARLRLQLGR